MPARGKCWSVICAAGVLVAVWTAVQAAEGPAQEGPQKQIVARTWNLCDFKQALDGQWEGITVASDGRCYFGSSTHSRETGASFFRFDRTDAKVTLLCEDIMGVCGEKAGPGVIPQGKLHSDICEMDGWLYTATHCPLYNDRPGYPGAHLIGYELATGKFRDFGVLEKGYTCYAGVAGDAKNRRVYVYLLWPGQANEKPCLLYRVDVADGKKTRVAELRPGGYDAAVYYLYVDDDGNCWLPEPDGVLVKYDAAADKIERFPDALPEKNKLRYPQWQWARRLPGRNKALVTTNAALYEFDPKAVRFRLILKDLGAMHLGVALGGDRVYFTQNEGPRDSPVHLKSIDLGAEKPAAVDHGRITDQDGRRPMRIESVAADGEGHVYMTGDWYVKPGDKPTLKGGQEINRSQRFAFVKAPVR